jgi:hypothetical protein
MKDNSSPISETERLWMSQETEMLKDKMFISGRDMVEETRDGELSIMTDRLRK